MLIPKKNRLLVYKYLFQEGVLFAEKNYNLLNHPAEIVPNTLKKSSRPMERNPAGDRPPRGERPPRGGFGGDRDDYRSAPPGGMGRGAPMDKGGAPGSYQPGFGRGN